MPDYACNGIYLTLNEFVEWNTRFDEGKLYRKTADKSLLKLKTRKFNSMPDLPLTRHSLLIRLKDRSDDAWSEFLAIYEKSIVDYARRKGLQDADALDVTQEVLSAVEKRITSQDSAPIEEFRGWLFRVARNIAVDKIKEQIKSPKSGGTNIAGLLAGHADENQQETFQFWQNYRRQLMHWAAAQVKPHVAETTWKAFWMTTMEGHTADKVAVTLGITRGNVYAAKFRVINRLQKLVEQFDDSSDFEQLLKEMPPKE